MTATTTTTTTGTTTVVVTRLDARGLRGLVRALRQTDAVVADCRAVEGFLGGRLAVDPRGVLWTLTTWSSPQALREFSHRHAPVAAGIDAVARDSAVTAFRQQGTAVPTWRQATGAAGSGPPALALTRTLAATG